MNSYINWSKKLFLSKHSKIFSYERFYFLSLAPKYEAIWRLHLNENVWNLFMLQTNDKQGHVYLESQGIWGNLGGRPVLSLTGRPTPARWRWPTEFWVFSWLAIFVFDCLFPWAQPMQKLASSRFFFRRALLTHSHPSPRCRETHNLCSSQLFPL